MSLGALPNLLYKGLILIRTSAAEKQFAGKAQIDLFVAKR